MDGKIVLIDGHSILNRAFYGLPDLTNAEGLHTNAVYGFLNILFKILEEEQADYLTVAFDRKAPTFRHQMYAEYKGTRKPMPEELRQQVPLMKEVLTAMDVPIVERDGYEADDIIGTLARRSEEQGLFVSVISGDRDLLQLATDRIRIRIPKTKRTGTEIEDYNAKEVLEHYQVMPLQIIDLKALMGDTADNIPGLPGVGEKTATKLIVEYGSLENAKAHEEEIKPNKARDAFKNHYDLAVLSKQLATIKTDCDLSFDYEKARINNLYTKEAYELFKRLEFKNLIGRFSVEEKEPKRTCSIRVIRELGEAQTVLERAKESDRIGFFVLGEKEHVLGLALCMDESEACVLLKEGFLTGEYLAAQLMDICSRVPLAASIDLKPQLFFLEGKKRESLFDCAIAAYLLNPLKSSYPYDDMAREFFGELLPSKEELLGKRSLDAAFQVVPEQLASYGGYVCYTAYRSVPVLREKLAEEGMRQLFEEVEMPLLFTLYDMECWGIRAKAEELKVYGEQLQIRISQLEREIYELAGEEFNINSPKQLGVILFEKLKMPFGKKTKTGYSTSADILDKLAPDYPLVADILEYRQLTKLKSTYADGLSVYIQEDGRIHSTFNQTITATGRISSTEPNLQNIPVRVELGRLIRKVFVPEDGYEFIDADYSQIELRVLAHMSGDKMLIQAYKEAQDIHRITASQVFHTPFEEVTDLQRRNAKAVNFGIVYGISSFGLSQGLSITRKEAAEYIEKYFETYPGVKAFLDQLVSDAKEKGYVTTMFGRRRPVPELKSSNFMQRSFGERVAMNSPIQGTAADIIKIAMIRVNERMKAMHMKSRLILQVHDELLIEAWKEEAETVKQILNEEMHRAADLSVSLEIDMHEGMTWYDAK
ncbi:MAG: DNA polymerase I [Lachnospiraceae bacterium]|nr:DNA polymerase I [Lachnospiraceae bacterium]